MGKKSEKFDPCGGRKGCVYWKRLDESGDVCACHYMIVHGVSRPKDADGNCLGYTARKLVYGNQLYNGGRGYELA